MRLFVGGLIWQLSSALHFVLDLLFGQDGCEVFHLKDLADFDFGVDGVGVGATLDPLDGLFMGLDLQDRSVGCVEEKRASRPHSESATKSPIPSFCKGNG